LHGRHRGREPLARLLIDDAQWLDPASAQALTSTACRLALIFALREPGDDDALRRLPGVAVTGDGAARRVSEVDRRSAPRASTGRG
jgi:hypothetical protein